MSFNIWILMSFLFLCGCNGNSGNGKNPSVTAGDVASNEESRDFIKSSSSDLPPSLQITEEELSSWELAGFLTGDEAKEIKINIK